MDRKHMKTNNNAELQSCNCAADSQLFISAPPADVSVPASHL